MTDTQVETETCKEETLLSLVTEIENKIGIIEALFQEHMNVSKDCCILFKKIIKIKSMLNLSELEFEYENNIKFIEERLQNIVNAQNTIIQVIQERGIEDSEITQRFDAIRNYVDELEKKIFQISDPSIFKGSTNEIRNHIKNYKQMLTKATNDINKELQKNIDDFNEENENIKTQQVSICQKSEDINTELNEFTQNINQQLTEYKQTFDAKNNEAEKKIADNILNCDNSLRSTSEKIEGLEKTSLDALKSIEEEYVQKFNELKEKANEDFENLQNDILKKDEKISKLIALVGNKANIGEYKSNADKAHTERIRWQIATVCIFVVAFIMMVCITVFTKDYNMTTLARYIVSVILLGMSGYTAKQAGNQRKDEIYFRKQQLELSSIDVYLDDMPEETKHEIKKALSNKIFGQASETYKNKYDDSANNTIDKISKMLENVMNTMQKK